VKAVFEMELIGDDRIEYERAKRQGRITRPVSLHREIDWLRGQRRLIWPWVARITGIDERYGLAREFVRCHKDYSRANSTGSRGIYAYYILGDGIYEVNQRESWKRTRRYFIRVVEDKITEISREEVLEWLNTSSASAS